VAPRSPDHRLRSFLAAAKKATYAAQGDEASVTPAFLGSKQLEFTDGPWHYRDVYYGFQSFAGLEVVERWGRPVWAMTYVGGVVNSRATVPQVRILYGFLRAALREVPSTHPFRGPPLYRTGSLQYVCEWSGDVGNFCGTERILLGTRRLYSLNFSGGSVR
jgi:Domain of unknown function (DUF5680)